MTLAQLARLCAKPGLWFDPLTTAMAAHWINTPARETMFLATALYESNGFLSLVENLNYSARGLVRVWPNRFTPQEAADYAAQPERIASRAYANRNGNGDEASGDGWRYRGRGLIQLTFASNYARAEAATGYPLLAQPELLEQAEASSEVAAWFWSDAGANEVADADDFAGTQGIVNRGSRTKVADNMLARNEWLGKVQAALT